MSEVFEKRLEELKEHKKLNHFEYEQLLCLNMIVGRLSSIDDRLRTINNTLTHIEAK